MLHSNTTRPRELWLPPGGFSTSRVATVPSTYNKPFRSFEDQLAILEHRGLIVEDRAQALRLLETVGYYTLGGYLYPMREIVHGSDPVTRADHFLDGASFQHVAALYQFDQLLRLLCLDALEAIERALKVRVAYYLGALDPFAHDNGSQHQPYHLQVQQRSGRADCSNHDDWRATHDRKVQKRGNDAIGAFAAKYGTPLPIWVAVDAMDFGDVSKLVDHLGGRARRRLGEQFEVSDPKVFVSWVRAMCHVRNIAAHHDRLWNRNLTDSPKKPAATERSHFAELLAPGSDWKRTYAALLVIAYIIRRVDPDSDWPNRMGAHLDQLPDGVGVNHAALGAPGNWRTNIVWSLV